MYVYTNIYDQKRCEVGMKEKTLNTIIRRAVNINVDKYMAAVTQNFTRLGDYQGPVPRRLLSLISLTISKQLSSFSLQFHN